MSGIHPQNEELESKTSEMELDLTKLQYSTYSKENTVTNVTESLTRKIKTVKFAFFNSLLLTI